MFRPPTVAIFREVFFEGYNTQNIKTITINVLYVIHPLKNAPLKMATIGGRNM
jgi:hypothetical protein